MNKGIVTTYYGPTNQYGARIKAQCFDEKLFVKWNYELDIVLNHEHAARELAGLCGQLKGNILIGGWGTEGTCLWIIAKKGSK